MEVGSVITKVGRELTDVREEPKAVASGLGGAVIGKSTEVGVEPR